MRGTRDLWAAEEDLVPTEETLGWAGGKRARRQRARFVVAFMASTVGYTAAPETVLWLASGGDDYGNRFGGWW